MGVEAVGRLLREVARPELYRFNAFRLTGLSTYADRQTIRRARRRVVAAVRSGADIDLGHDLPVEADGVDAAFERLLGDSRRRLVDELFWTWSDPNATCACSEELHREHDLAVEAHCAALDRELTDDNPLDAELERLWADAGRRWDLVVRRPDVAEHVRSRIQALDDRQLDVSLVDELLGELPEVLVTPLIQLAASADGSRQDRLAGRARRWPLPGHLIEDRLEAAFAPAYDEVRAAMAEAGELQRDGSHYRAARLLTERVIPPLRRLRELLPPDRHRRTQEALDGAAIVLNNCAMGVLNQAGPSAPSPEAERWLEQARELATTAATVQAIEGNLRQVNPLRALMDQIQQTRESGAPDEELIGDMLAESGGTPPRGIGTRVRSPARDRRVLTRLLVWVGLPLLGWWLFFSPGGKELSLSSEKITDNAPVGSCIATRADWDRGEAVVPAADCGKPHWGEVLGYVPLGAVPSPYPGDEWVQATAYFECQRLLVQRVLANTQFTTPRRVPNQPVWNDGQRPRNRFENYVTCVASRVDDEPMLYQVVDLDAQLSADVAVPMKMNNAELWANPPVGTCLEVRPDYTSSTQVVGCEQPHWAEVLGYPRLYEPGARWPGFARVDAAAVDACQRLPAARTLPPGYQLNAGSPRALWNGPGQPIYATCTVSRTNDEAFTGSVR